MSCKYQNKSMVMPTIIDVYAVKLKVMSDQVERFERNLQQKKNTTERDMSRGICCVN